MGNMLLNVETHQGVTDMAHELSFVGGKAEMAFTGSRGAIWHGLGQNLAEDAPIEVWAQQAGYSHKICRSRVRFGESADQRIMDSRHVLFRSDTKAPLSVVSADYVIHQPIEILEFFRDLVAGEGFKLSTAGQLFGGTRYWALASVGEDAVVLGQDRVKGYVLLVSSCDGSLATTGKFVATRVVCNNTLTVGLGETGKAARVYHRSGFSAEAMKAKLGIVRGAFRESILSMRKMAETKISDADAQKFVADVVVETGATTKDAPEKSKPFQSAMALFRGLGMGSKMEGADGTLWGVVNGITEYVDHHARGKTASHVLDNAWFGKGDALKTLAFDKALEIVG